MHHIEFRLMQNRSEKCHYNWNLYTILRDSETDLPIPMRTTVILVPVINLDDHYSFCDI